MNENNIGDYLEQARNMPELISSTGKKIIDAISLINDSYNEAPPSGQAFLERNKTALLKLSKRFNGLKLKHMTGKFIMEKFPSFKDNFIENPIDDDFLNIPAAAVITGLSGDVLSNYRSMSKDIDRIYNDVKNYRDGRLNDYELTGLRPIISHSDNATLPVTLGIGALIFAGYYFFNKKKRGRK